MKIFLNIAGILFMCNLNAQNSTLKGQFKGENIEKSFINIINIDQAKATISKIDGTFEIEAKVGDTILISSLQYKEIKFIVKPEYFEESIEIKLTFKITQLDQINLYSYGLTGNIERDIDNIEVFDFTVDQLGFSAKVEFDSGHKNRYSAKERNTDLIYNAINANLKIEGGLTDEELLEIRKIKFNIAIPDNYLEQDIGIPENRIEDFKYFCIEKFPVVNVFIQNNELLKLYEALDRIAQEYFNFRNIKQN